MKKQPSMLEDIITTLIAAALAFVVTTAIVLVWRIIWPSLRFCAIATWKGMRKLRALTLSQSAQ